MIVIAMTTEIGSLGGEVAAGLAAKLGLRIVRVADVADPVANRIGINPTAALRFLNGTESLLERWQIDSHKFFNYATEEILRLAQSGDVLIKGCGGPELLQNVPGVIGVRVCAPVAFRIRVLMEREETSDRDAVRARIEHAAAARARMRRALLKFGDEDVCTNSDACSYHVTINTERMSVDACVRLITELVGNHGFSARAGMRSILAEKFVEAKIRSAFTEHISQSVAPLGVKVSVVARRVTLEGVSCSGSLHRRAEEIARSVAGALPIENRIISVPLHGRPTITAAQRPNSATL
jgi:cytidylate kinase